MSPLELDYVEAVGYLVCRIIRETLGEAEGFASPANQRRPSGATSVPYCTVQLTSSSMVGYNTKRYDAADPAVAAFVPLHSTLNLLEVIDSLEEFTASVHFYRSGEVDDRGRAIRAGNAAQSKALRLVKLLDGSSAGQDRIRSYGLGYAGASKVRDLSGPVPEEGSYENHVQVDLTFYASNPEALALSSSTSVAMILKVQQPDNTISEVTQ